MLCDIHKTSCVVCCVIYIKQVVLCDIHKTSRVVGYTEPQSIVTTQRRFVQRFGMKITQPSDKSIEK